MGRKGAAIVFEQRRKDPAKMKAWLRAMQLGRKRKAREKKHATPSKEAPVAKKKAKVKDWRHDPKLMLAAVMKGHRTRRRLRREREREQAAKEAQRNVVAHHSPDDLVHLEFPVVPGTRVNSGGHLGDDLTQLTPAFRKQLALEGLRFIKILLE